MRLVILDGHPLNPGDLSWAGLESLAEVTYFPRTSTDEVCDRLRKAEALLVNKIALSANIFEQCPQLRYIGVCATGFNIIDVAAARAHGITVTNVPGYSTDSVAQLVFALLLEITHHVGHHAFGVANGAWSKQPDFSYADFPIIELAGKTMGIFGFGQIGQTVGRIAHAFGMRVIYASRSERPSPDYPARRVELAELFREADVVSLHCPLTEETKDLIAWPLLTTMKPTAILINTARGQLINETDLVRALEQGVIAGAGLDVLIEEPPALSNVLLSAPRVFVTPHIGWASAAARRRLMKEVVENFRSFLNGNPRNVVS